MQKEFYTLVIGNKNYSSWSLRAWLMLKAIGEPFNEILIPLDQENTKKDVLRYSPSGLVPVLVAENVSVWDTLAIAETLAERHPSAMLWPTDAKMRAHARAISAEMHSGFTALRKECPMDIKKRAKVTLSPAVASNVMRIEHIWAKAREYSVRGDFLFGHFTIADAMYAPVVSRFITYGISVNKENKKYMEAVWELPAMRQWVEAAQKETWVL